MNHYWPPLIGGMIIGLSVTIMLLFNGRVTGISGILSSTFVTQQRDRSWRVAFLLGLIIGGLALSFYDRSLLLNSSDRSLLAVSFAGLIVGFGTVLGSGCTSGHGVCGISRLSTRSIVATLVFIFFGIMTVSLVNWWKS